MRKLRRRDFLKYSAAGASIFAANHFFGDLFASTTFEKGCYADRCTEKRVKGVPTTCTGCFAHCGLVAYVLDGQLMRAAGNPAHPVNKGTLCMAGQASIYKLYDPERVTKPLVKAGKRGQDRWKEVTWDEALAIAAENIKAKADQGVVLETLGGSSEPASREFLSRIGGGTLASHGYAVSPSRERALQETFGASYDLPDIVNAGYILNFGANPYESDYSGVRTARGIESRKTDNDRVKMVTFDPRLSMTAGRGDEWYPLLPGTDAVVALAMAHVIMNEGLLDKAFIETRTNTSLSQLTAHLAQYTPAKAEWISGVSAADIRRIAIEYASADKAVLLTGGGVSKHFNGTANERAVRLLPIITGKINRKGCNFIPAACGFTGQRVQEITPERFHGSLQEGTAKAGVYIVQGADPVYSSPIAANMARALADEAAVPFVMCVDTNITDTGRYADLILPASTFLEEYGLELSYGQKGEAVYGFRKPAVQPVGDSRPYVEVLSALAARLGKPLSFEDSGEYARKLLAEAPCLPDNGVLAALDSSGFCSAPASAGGKARIEAAWGKELPAFIPPGEYKDIKNDSLVMVTYAPAAYREGFTENNLYTKEIAHSNNAFINTQTGQRLGLKSWDKVRIISPVGTAEALVILSPGIHPKVLAIARGCGHEGWGNIENAEKFDGSDPATSVIWWEGDGKGINTSTLVPFNIDEASGGQGWMLTAVTLEKA
jgi:thiosulfate reductase / polysulfide reductase chain A